MKRENVKYVEVFNNFSKNVKWEKRIFLEKFPDGSCLHVAKGEEEIYLNYEPYCNIKKHRDLWREIAVPEYVQYDSVEDFKDRLADGWIIDTTFSNPDRIISTLGDGIFIARGKNVIYYFFSELFNEYIWYSDGAPCGKLREVIK